MWIHGTNLLCIFLTVCFFVCIVDGAYNRPNEACEIQFWPLPRTIYRGTNYALIDPATLEIVVEYANGTSVPKDVAEKIENIIQIHKNNFFQHGKNAPVTKTAENDIPVITKLSIQLSPTYENGRPTINTNESYILEVNQTMGIIKASSNSGVYYGLTTFSQIILFSNQTNPRFNCLGYPLVNGYFVSELPLVVFDSPRFKWRGFLIDCSRNFLPIDTIKMTVDAISYSKMNVLHLHLTDAQSFPVVFANPLSQLGNLGAYSDSEKYSLSDFVDLINYSNERGVRIIPEFDSPGHTYAWSYAFPDLVVCQNTQPEWGLNCAEPPCGQLDPSNSMVYSIFSDIFTQVAQTFNDDNIHLGYDEINFHCWNSSANIRQFKREHKLNDTGLLQYYFDNQLNVFPPNKQPIYWEEVLTMGLNVPDNAIIQMWETKIEYWEFLYTKPNPILLSNHKKWYLDCGFGSFVSMGSSWCAYSTWEDVYLNEPLYNITDIPNVNERALGGEVALWGELVDKTNLMERAFPRASAAGERLWSSVDVVNTFTALPRILAHREYLVKRGIPAAPIQPQWCTYNPNDCHFSRQ